MPSHKPGPRPRNQAEYKKNRALLLADDPPCYWCGDRATEADHLIEVDRFIGEGVNSLDNLVPSCRRCNATRGNKYKGARDKAKKKNAESGKAVFFPEAREAPVSPFILSNSINTRVSSDLPEPVRIGHDRPRLETTTESSAGNLGNEISDFATNVLGVDLLPWQRHVIEGFTSYDAAGDWLHRIALVTVARQNGKTTLASAVIGHYLATQGAARGYPVTVMSVSHKLDLSTALFNYLAPILEVKFGANVSWAYGRQKVEMQDGSTWHVRAATQGAGHGYSVDLIFVDELWSVSEDALDQGLLPSQRARKNPLCLMVSTAGTQESKALIRWKEQGLRGIETGKSNGLYFAEFSPPPTVDYMTPEAWAYSNPSLGHFLPLKVLESEAAGPNRGAFLRASVNIPTAAGNAWLEPGVFANLATEEEAPPGGFLAVEVATDESRFVGVRAVQHPNGKTHVVLSFVVDTMAEVWTEIEREVKADSALKVLLVPSLEIAAPAGLMERRGAVVGYRELHKWTATVRAAILEGRIQHNDQELLTQHVDRSVMVKQNGTISISTTRSPGPIEACRCMIWAAASAAQPKYSAKPRIVNLVR